MVALRKYLTVISLLLCSGIAIPTIVAAPCPNGMVSYWTFDDSADPGNDDYNGNDGIVEGATWTSGGKVGGAMCFDGINDYIWVNDNKKYDAFTYSAWVKLNSYSGKEMRVIKHANSKTQGGGEMDKALTIYDNGTACVVESYSYTTDYHVAVSSTSLNLNTW